MSLTKETVGPTAAQDRSGPQPVTGKKIGDAGHPQPVCIEVPVTVQGVRPATDPGKREPFTESTRTVLVFANGAVLRLGTAVNPGQLIFLTNEHTKKEVVCQVVKSKTYQNVAGYIELEFTEPNVGFWGISFPGERLEPQGEAQAPGASQTLAKLQPLAPAPLPPLRAARQTTPGERAPKTESHPAPAVPAQIPHATVPARKEASHAEAQLSAADPLPAHPELIRPRGNGSAGVSEPLVFSGSKMSARPAAPAAKTHVEEYVEPAVSPRSVFEEAIEAEFEEPKSRRMPVGALIAAGLILAVAGGGWYWWRNSRYPSAANSSSHSANAATLVAPPTANMQTASALSSPLHSSSSASASETAKPATVSGHPSAPGPAQPVNSSPTSPEASRPVEKPAESHESTTQAGKKPALSGFRLSTPSAARPAPNLRGAGNPEPAPGVDSASAIPGAASPEGISGLVGAAGLQPEAPKPEPPAGGEIKPARLVSSTPPTYPPLARSQRIEGDVTVDALIDATGRVTTIKVISGPVLLQQSAAAAVRLWKYEPATLNGEAVPMHLVVTVKFRLR